MNPGKTAANVVKPSQNNLQPVLKTTTRIYRTSVEPKIVVESSRSKSAMTATPIRAQLNSTSKNPQNFTLNQQTRPAEIFTSSRLEMINLTTESKKSELKNYLNSNNIPRDTSDIFIRNIDTPNNNFVTPIKEENPFNLSPFK